MSSYKAKRLVYTALMGDYEKFSSIDIDVDAGGRGVLPSSSVQGGRRLYLT